MRLLIINLIIFSGLTLVDEEEDLEARQPTKATSVPVLVPIKDSELEVVEVPLLRKRTLKKVADVAASEVEPVTVVNVANFLATQRK